VKTPGSDVANATSQPSGWERRIERAIAWLYRWLASNRVTRVPWAVIQTFSRAQGALLSGSMAYYTFLSLLPLIMVALFLLGSVFGTDPTVRAALARGVNQIFPGVQGGELIDQLVRARLTFGVFGFIAIVYAGSGFIGALTASLNRMWEVRAGRNPLGQKVVNLVIVGLLGAVLLGSAGMTIYVSGLAKAAFGGDAGPVADLLELVVAPISVFVVLLLMYRVLPARKLTWRSQIPGALLGAVGLEVLKRAFALWTDWSAGVSALPRSLLLVVLLLLWLGFFSQLILYGAALNVVIDHRRAGRALFSSGEPQDKMMSPRAETPDRAMDRSP
jgi:YihY family inner membrane protein